MFQLDLFRDSRAATVLGVVQPFPLYRRHDLLAEIMHGLANRNERAGKRFWNDKVREIRRDLKRQGIAKSDIDEQMAALVRTVQIEFDYRLERWREG